MIERQMSAGAWGLLATLSLLWGGTFFFSEVALADLPPFSLVLARLTLASLTRLKRFE